MTLVTLTKVMVSVMMEIIMLHANLMEETVVDPMWTKHSAQCVPVLKGLEVWIHTNRHPTLVDLGRNIVGLNSMKIVEFIKSNLREFFSLLFSCIH